MEPHQSGIISAVDDTISKWDYETPIDGTVSEWDYYSDVDGNEWGLLW